MPGPYREGSVWSRNSPSLLPAKRNAPHAPRRTRRETERYPAMIRQMTSRPLNCRSTDLFQSEIRKSGKEKGRYQGVGTGRNRHSQNQTGHPGTSGHYGAVLYLSRRCSAARSRSDACSKLFAANFNKVSTMALSVLVFANSVQRAACARKRSASVMETGFRGMPSTT